jgi:hypothetical protein
MAAILGFVFLIGFPAALVAAVVLARKLSRTKAELERFRPILSIEEQVRQKQAEHAHALAALQGVQQAQQRVVQEHAQQTQAEQARANAALWEVQQERQRIASELAELEQRVELHDVGLLAPRFNFAEATEYKIRLDQIRDQQGAMVKAGRAAVCSSEWTIAGSRSEGKKTTDQILKLMLRAFNGECDALVAKVRYDNAAAFNDKMRKSWESINKLGRGFTCSIDSAYLDLKLQELHLTHEYQEKLQAEREEQRALREQMRDEERAQKELERAQREAEQEETRYAKALERAREEAEHAVGAKQQKLLEQITDLEQKVKDADERRQRAVSMAQLTKTGHVYVLSNVGSFGDYVFKIGMTRRLDPQDRVDELGDASVPFPFDVHAMIRSDNAPGLERALHGLFESERLNKVNRRKEFFRVTLEQIEYVVRQHHGEFKLTQYAEAVEYRKSLAMSGAATRGESVPVQAQARS